MLDVRARNICIEDVDARSCGMTRGYRTAIVICSLLGALCLARPAGACDFGGRTWEKLFDDATDVFVGKVVAGVYLRDAAGKIAVDRSVSETTRTRFSVETRYKGSPTSEMTIEGSGGNCDFPFVVGDTYLIFGAVLDGRFYTGQVWLPLRLTPPDDL